MYRLLSTARKPLIYITENAATKMKKILSINTSYTCFLFSAVSGGCNGFNYNLKLLNSKEYKKLLNDKPSTINIDKISVIIEPLSEMYLLGTTIDYIFEDINKGIFENKFTFNPDTDKMSSCGCGISFNPK